MTPARLLHIPYYVLRIAYCVLRIAYCVLRIPYCVLRIAYCVLRIAYCILRIAYWVLHIPLFLSLPKDWVLGLAYSVVPELAEGLHIAYYVQERGRLCDLGSSKKIGLFEQLWAQACRNGFSRSSDR